MWSGNVSSHKILFGPMNRKHINDEKGDEKISIENSDVEKTEIGLFTWKTKILKTN